jgi:hypothetical protein
VLTFKHFISELSVDLMKKARDKHIKLAQHHKFEADDALDRGYDDEDSDSHLDDYMHHDEKEQHHQNRVDNLSRKIDSKEQRKKTVKENLQQRLAEIRMSDLPVRKIKGHSYGNQPEDHDDEDDEDNKPAMKKPESTEKRGRGRPAGAKSGAKQIGSASKQKSGVEYTGYKLHLPNSNR